MMASSRTQLSIVAAILIAAALTAVAAGFFDPAFARRLFSVALILFAVGMISGLAVLLTRTSGKSDPHSPTVVASEPDEMSAAAIVTLLDAHAISARALGGYTSGFQTEIASDVKVVVAHQDAAAARDIIAGQDSPSYPSLDF